MTNTIDDNQIGIAGAAGTYILSVNADQQGRGVEKTLIYAPAEAASRIFKPQVVR